MGCPPGVEESGREMEGSVMSDFGSLTVRIRSTLEFHIISICFKKCVQREMLQREFFLLNITYNLYNFIYFIKVSLKIGIA